MHKNIKVAYARPPTEDIRGSNLYVANLPRSMTQEELTNLFSPYGQIVNVKILMDSFTGLSKGKFFYIFCLFNVKVTNVWERFHKMKFIIQKMLSKESLFSFITFLFVFLF